MIIHSITRVIVCMALATVTVVGFGCASNHPTMSGLPLGRTRIVKVGDTVELRMPIVDGTRQWRVSSYDSFYLTLSGRPELNLDASGKGSMIILARAKSAGETTVEVRETNPPRGREARTVRFDVRIVN